MGWGETLDKKLSDTVVEPTQTVVEPAVVAPVTTEGAVSWGATLDNEPISEPKVEDVDSLDEAEGLESRNTPPIPLDTNAVEPVRNMEELKRLIAIAEEEILIAEAIQGKDVGGRDEAGNLLPVANENLESDDGGEDVPGDIVNNEFVPFSGGDYSGFKPTVEALARYMNPPAFVKEDEKGNTTELSDAEIATLGKTFAKDLLNPESGFFSPGRSKAGVFEQGMAAIFDTGASGTKFMMGVMGLIDTAGAAAKDTLELVLEGLADDSPERNIFLKANIPLPIGDINTKTIYNGIKSMLQGLTGNEKIDTPTKIVDLGSQMAMAGLEFGETIAGPLGGYSQLLTARFLSVNNQVKSGININKKNAAELKGAIRNNVGGAKLAGRETRNLRRDLAALVAEQNVEIRDSLILDFESRLSGELKISKMVDGHLVIDGDLTREAGRATLRRPFEVVTEADGTPSVVNDALSKLMGSEDGFVSPVLNPDKLNALVAVISEYKIRAGDSPDNPFNNPKVKPIDAIVSVTINKGIKETQELMDSLNKYDLSLEDFVLSSVASFSDAGKILQIASQLKRVRPDADLAAANSKALMEAEAGIANASQRLENIRRGSLVSKLATAGRNLESFGVRLPMENLMSLMDEVVFSYNEKITLGPEAKGGFLGVAKTLGKKSTWKNSFSAWEYAFSRPDVADGYMKLMLDNPQFTTMYNKMYDNLNEIQKAGGRGSGTKVDKILSPLEDTVEMLNVANRWQEKLTRNAIAMSEIETLVRREWKIDLRDALNDGKLPDMFNDASTIRPEGARSFNAMMSEATEKALRVTYGAQPEGDIARYITQGLTSKKMFGVIPLTTIVAFPRFMFASMEFMAESTAGAAGPLVRKLVGAQKGPMTAKQQRAVQRNLVGGAAIYAAYLYRSSENAPAKYEDVRIMGKDADTTTQFPLRQFLYVGEVAKQIEQGTFSEFWDPKAFAETFIGSSMRTGAGNIIIEEIAALADGMDISKSEKAAEIVGELISNYVSTYFVGPSQATDFDRMVGRRPNKFTENPKAAPKGTIDAFTRELRRGPDRMGLTVSAQTESALPTKTTVFPEDAIRPDASWRGLLGISLKDQASEDQEFVTSLGIPAWKMGSNSDIDTVKVFENEQIGKFLPLLIVQLNNRRDKLEKDYDLEPDSTKEEITKEAYLLFKTKGIFTDIISKFKGKLKSMSGAVADDYSFRVSAFNRIPKKYRREAYADWIVANDGIDPDITEIQILKDLLNRAQQVQKQTQRISSRATKGIGGRR